MGIKNTAIYAENTTGDPYLDLSAAIIRCAIQDYTKMRRRHRETENGLLAEKFILSRWFAFLSLGAIDGRELLDRIDKKCQEEDDARQRKQKTISNKRRP